MKKQIIFTKGLASASYTSDNHAMVVNGYFFLYIDKYEFICVFMLDLEYIWYHPHHYNIYVYNNIVASRALAS